MKKEVIFIILIILILPITYSQNIVIQVRPIVSNSIQANTGFNYTFNFTNNEDCTSVIYSNFSYIVTDVGGVGYVNLTIPINSSIKYLCEYRDGVLRKVHTLGISIVDNLYSSNININNNLTLNGNITLGEKILFGFGGLLEDFVNYFSFNKNLKIYGNTTINGTLIIGNKSKFLSNLADEPGEAYFDKSLALNGALATYAQHFGYNLLGLKSGVSMNYTGLRSTGIFSSIDSTFCDYTNNIFEERYISKYLTVINSTGQDYKDATGEFIGFLNSSCMRINIASSGNSTLSNGFNVSYFIYDHPNVALLDNGFFSFFVGENPDARFEIQILNGSGNHGFYIEDVAGSQQHKASTIDTDMNGFGGVIGQNIYMHTTKPLYNKSLTELFMTIDLRNVRDSTANFIDAYIINNGSGNTANFLQLDGNINNIITLGSKEDIILAWLENSTGIYNMTGNLTTKGQIDWPLWSTDDSVLYIGSSNNFTKISMDFNITSSANLLFEYYFCNETSNGDTGYYTLPAVVDTTDGATASGAIEFTNPKTRGKCHTRLNSGTGNLTDLINNMTYIAIKRTRNFVSRYPIERIFSIAGSTNYFILQKDMIKLQPTSSPPEICGANFEGAIYSDDDLNLPCFCTGANWVQMDDFSTVCS